MVYVADPSLDNTDSKDHRYYPPMRIQWKLNPKSDILMYIHKKRTNTVPHCYR